MPAVATTKSTALTTLSSPQWLNPLLAALSESIRTAEGIPESRAPSASQRQMIENRIAELEALKHAIDMRAAMTEVTGLLVSFPMQSLSDSTARARAAAYTTALEDLPAWAISEACRRWIRGDVTGDCNFNFAPSPPVLRNVVTTVMLPLLTQQAQLRMLLKARVEREFTPEHCATMRQKFIALMQSIMGTRAIVPPKDKPAPMSDAELVAHYAAKEVASA